MDRLYETDYTNWAEQTAQLLVERRFDAIDLEALIEEVTSLGASERRAYRSCLRLIAEHLLKLAYASYGILKSHQREWRLSVNNARREIVALLEANASAARDRDKALVSAYRQALGNVREECEDFGPVMWPETCPWTIEQMLDETFWPEQA